MPAAEGLRQRPTCDSQGDHHGDGHTAGDIHGVMGADAESSERDEEGAEREAWQLATINLPEACRKSGSQQCMVRGKAVVVSDGRERRRERHEVRARIGDESVESLRE